mmetsp:Transcript_4413/g.6029  ORF Transcript_4413/g.6029 Transcript_4413/m.6029 type:complete len:120 (-) Transcript_4413:1238-1597(-)
MAICLMAVAEALTRLDYHCFRGHCFSSLLYRGYWKLTKHVHNDSILIITLLDMGLRKIPSLGKLVSIKNVGISSLYISIYYYNHQNNQCPLFPLSTIASIFPPHYFLPYHHRRRHRRRR